MTILTLVIILSVINLIRVGLSRFANKNINIEVYVSILYFLNIIVLTTYIILERNTFIYIDGTSALLYVSFLVLYVICIYYIYKNIKSWLKKGTQR